MPSLQRLGLALIGLLAGLLLAEAVLRLGFDQRWYNQKEFVYEGSYYMQCYPTDPHGHMPRDLTRKSDADWARSILRDDLKVRRLALRTPYCVAADTSEHSARAQTGPSSSAQRIALIGDSFAYGEGVADDQTFGYHLSSLTGAFVRNYGEPGADIADVRGLFSRALRERRRYHFRWIIYLFVLNDPLITPELRRSQDSLDDLINLRIDSLDQDRDLSAGMRLLWKIGRWSSTAKAIARALAVDRVSARTVRWYQDVFDPAKNPELPKTFAIIAGMKREAQAQGIAFTVAVYPLLVELDHYPLRAVHQTISEALRRDGVDTIDLLPVFQAHAHEDLVVNPIDAHPNGAAHRLAAEAVFKGIIAE